MEIKYIIRAEAAIRAMETLPAVMIRHLDGAANRGAQEVAREEKLILAENRSMARSILANSIHVIRVAPMHYRVATGVNYARAVEEGTGPAVGQKAYMPNPVHLRDYVKQRAGIRFTGKPGSLKRRGQHDEIRDRAWALAVYIRKHGTRPHPYAKPAVERKESRVRELLRRASIDGVREVFGGRA